MLKREEITVIVALQKRIKYGLAIVSALAIAVFASNSTETRHGRRPSPSHTAHSDGVLEAPAEHGNH